MFGDLNADDGAGGIWTMMSFIIHMDDCAGRMWMWMISIVQMYNDDISSLPIAADLDVEGVLCIYFKD